MGICPFCRKSESSRRVPDTVPSFDQQVYQAINVARTRPHSYVGILQQMKPSFQGLLYKRNSTDAVLTKEGADAVQEAIDFLVVQNPLPQLYWNEKMHRATKAHAEECGETGNMSERSIDGSKLTQRMAKINMGLGERMHYSESIRFGMTSAEQIVVNLLIDDGDESRKNRSNIFSSIFQTCAISSNFHKTQGNVVVIDFSGEGDERVSLSTSTRLSLQTR